SIIKQGTDHDVEIEIAVLIKVADTTGIEYAITLLILLYQFHRAQFWRACNRAGRKAVLQYLGNRNVVTQGAADGRDHLVNLPETVNAHQLRDTDTACPG